MLTKQERAAIAKTAESLSDYTLYYSEIYKCLYGEYPRNDMPNTEYDKAVIDRIVDLCNTSNMIELPLDKDGEVIRVGDTVYDSNGEEYKITGYKTLFENTNIILSNGSEVAYTEKYPHNLIHKQPVIIELLVARIKRVMDDDSTTVWAYDELDDIAKQLEQLGDSDD